MTTTDIDSRSRKTQLVPLLIKMVELSRLIKLIALLKGLRVLITEFGGDIILTVPVESPMAKLPLR